HNVTVNASGGSSAERAGDSAEPLVAVQVAGSDHDERPAQLAQARTTAFVVEVALPMPRTVVLDGDLDLGIGEVQARDERTGEVAYDELRHRPREPTADNAHARAGLAR